MTGARGAATEGRPARPPRIAVVGAADASEEERHFAGELGAALARAGAVVVCGGYGGVMEAAARGAAEAGGLTVGILKGEDAGEANAWIALPIPTGMGDARNALVVRAAEALVAVGGAWGTLSEIALARKAGLAVGTLGTPPAGDLGLPALETPAAAAAWALARAREARERRGEKPPAGSGQSRRPR
jgi:uncharacterized protein (TIGR00725 family)